MTTFQKVLLGAGLAAIFAYLFLYRRRGDGANCGFLRGRCKSSLECKSGKCRVSGVTGGSSSSSPTVNILGRWIDTSERGQCVEFEIAGDVNNLVLHARGRVIATGQMLSDNKVALTFSKGTPDEVTLFGMVNPLLMVLVDATGAPRFVWRRGACRE